MQSCIFINHPLPRATNRLIDFRTLIEASSGPIVEFVQSMTVLEFSRFSFYFAT
jgi:hypothetical protein